MLWDGLRRSSDTPLMLAALLVLWQAAVMIFKIPEFILPSPVAVFQHLFFQQPDANYNWWRHISATLIEVVIAFAVTAVVGFVIAVIITWSRTLREFTMPLLIFVNSLPIVAVAPVILLWFGYGLGTMNRNLPGFVVLNGGLIPPGGFDCFGSGFLPATYQGSIFLPREQSVANIQPQEPDRRSQKNKLELIARLDRATFAASGYDPQIEGAIQNYETAFRMQSSVPELMDLRGESDAVKKLYGLEADYDNTKTFGLQCLLARRLVERGVRFVELFHGDWDTHGTQKRRLANLTKEVDQPVALFLLHQSGRERISDRCLARDVRAGFGPAGRNLSDLGHDPPRRGCHF